MDGDFEREDGAVSWYVACELIIVVVGRILTFDTGNYVRVL